MDKSGLQKLKGKGVGVSEDHEATPVEAPCALRKHRFGRNLRLHWRGLNGRGSIDRHLDEGFRHLHPRLYGARFPHSLHWLRSSDQ